MAKLKVFSCPRVVLLLLTTLLFVNSFAAEPTIGMKLKITWEPVLLDTNGNSITVDSYRIYFNGAPVFETKDLFYTTNSLPIEPKIKINVTAIRAGLESAFSQDYIKLIQIPQAPRNIRAEIVTQ